MRALGPETVDFNLRLLRSSEKPGNRGPGQESPLYLHLGLAMAATKRDYAEHNRVEREGRLRNRSVRGRSRFGMAMLATALACGLVAGAYALAIRSAQAQTARLSSQASAYRAQVEAIRHLRTERARLLAALAGLKPLWSGPIPWSEVFAELSGALPAQSGIDGLQVERERRRRALPVLPGLGEGLERGGWNRAEALRIPLTWRRFPSPSNARTWPPARSSSTLRAG